MFDKKEETFLGASCYGRDPDDGRIAFYWVVSTIGRLSATPTGVGAPGGGGVAAQFRDETGQLLPVAFMTIWDEVEGDDDVVAQPVNMLMAATLTRAIRMICRRRRFFRPPIHSNAAKVAPASSGLGPP